MVKYETMTVDELVAESQRIGEQVDRLKEERRVIKHVIDAKLSKRATPFKGATSVDAFVEGVALTAESSKE